MALYLQFLRKIIWRLVRIETALSSAQLTQNKVSIMISSTLLKNLLDKKQYQEFQNVLEKHYSSEDKLDVSSSQKVTNLIAFQLANEKNFDNNVFSMLIKYFEVALVSLIQNEIIDTVILEKVLGSCYHVSTIEKTFILQNYFYFLL